MKKVFAIVAALCVAMLAVGFMPAEAEAASLKAATVTATKAVKVKKPPQAERVVRGRDGNLYALYITEFGPVAAFTGLKKHAKTITIPRYVKFRGFRYEVKAIHELHLTERTDIKRVRILAKDLWTVEEPAMFKSWRKAYGKKLKVSIKYREIREWLNANYEWR